MQDVEVPFDEVVRPMVCSEDEANDILANFKTKMPKNDNEEDEIPDLLMDSMITSESSSMEQSMITTATTPQKEEADTKRMTSLLLQEEDEEDQQLPDSLTASIITSSSSFHSVAEDEDSSSVDTTTHQKKVRLPDFDDRFDHESAAFALVDTMLCAPVDLVCRTNPQNDVIEDEYEEKEDADDIRAGRLDDDDTYTFFPRKQKEQTSKFAKLQYAACGAEEVAPKSMISEAMDSWNILLQKMGSQLTMQEFLERPTPSFQSASNGSNDS